MILTFLYNDRSHSRVGIDIPKIEVRFEHLNIGADIYVGKRALPTLLNFTLNTIQVSSEIQSIYVFLLSPRSTFNLNQTKQGIFDYLHVAPSRNQTFTILHDISGIIKPSRFVYSLL